MRVINKKREKYTDFFESAKKSMPVESIAISEENAKKTIFKIKLSDLRIKQGLKQTDIKVFSQPSLSRMESRPDMKISTLIEYIHSLDMELEIRVKSKSKLQNGVILYKG